ncbi:unnamed protein product [Malus baccata var. baccata]
MLSAARLLLPLSLSVLVAIYNYYKSRQKSEFSEGVKVPLNPTSVPSPAPSDRYLEILHWIRTLDTLDPALLNRIRNRDPALLHEIQQFDPAVEIRNFDPSIVDKIRNLDPAFPSEFSESVGVAQNPPSVPSPEPSVVEILDWIGTLGPAVLDEIQQFDPAFLDEDRNFDPSIVDGIRKLSLKEKEEKAEEEEKVRETEKEKENEKERKREKSESSSSGGGGGGGNENGGEVEEEVVGESSRRNQYPLRPEAGDCRYDLRTGNCKFGSDRKNNHLRRRKNKQVPKESVKDMDESAENPSQTECKYYLRSGGCKHGENCRYSHSKGKLELNFLGLPIRPGKRECPYYMQNGSCKYASNCRFNHPDPTATGGSDPPSGYGNGGPAFLQGASQSTVAPWSAPRPLNEDPVYSTLMIPPPQLVSSQNSEWNGYQASTYAPERSMPARPPYMMNNSVAETNVYRQHPHQNQVEEFPERPGQPLCSSFLRKGDCKFKSKCKYHHPKTHRSRPPNRTH